jgi:hypothetical protein
VPKPRQALHWENSRCCPPFADGICARNTNVRSGTPSPAGRSGMNRYVRELALAYQLGDDGRSERRRQSARWAALAIKGTRRFEGNENERVMLGAATANSAGQLALPNSLDQSLRTPRQWSADGVHPKQPKARPLDQGDRRDREIDTSRARMNSLGSRNGIE